MQMKKAGAAAVEWLSITVATAIVAAAVYFFLIPSQVPVGSVSSLAMVLGTMIPLPISAITMILNVTLLLLGFLFIGREFGAKTVYTSLLLPVDAYFAGRPDLVLKPEAEKKPAEVVVEDLNEEGPPIDERTMQDIADAMAAFRNM